MKTFAVPSAVPAIGQAQVVQRPNSPHASEVEPSVDEVRIGPGSASYLIVLLEST